MTIRCANRDLINYAVRHISALGYGNMSVITEDYSTGITVGSLPYRLANLLWQRRTEDKIGTVIYSYNTPIAWFDKEYARWVIPQVRYSVTTSKHQGYLWRLSNAAGIVFDTPLDEYLRVMEYEMVYTNNGTKPNPNPVW